MNTRAIIFGAAAALTLTIGAASAAPGGIKSMNDVLVDINGMTLYTFDKDTSGTSNCYDGCAVSWPPVAAIAGDATEGDYSIIERKDGSSQWAYKDQPLYLWISDTQPGDTTGDGVGGVWHVIAE